MNRRKKKEQKNTRKRYYRYGGVVLDTVIAVFGIIAVVLAVILFLNFHKNLDLSPFVLAAAAAMNLCLAVKYFKRHEKGKFASFTIQAILMGAAAVVVYLALDASVL